MFKEQAIQRSIQGQELARRRKQAYELMQDMDDDEIAAAMANIDNENTMEDGPGNISSSSLSKLAMNAQMRSRAYENDHAEFTNNNSNIDMVHLNSQESSILSNAAKAGASTRRAFFKHVRTLVEKSDIILEVLDARDPLACRASAVEALALSQNPPRRIVLILNKIDLVPAAVVTKWLAYLRREFPTIAFKASTQSQKSNISAPTNAAVSKATEAGEVITGSGAAGADTLIQLIKNYSRSHNMKQAVTVGIIGYPNVGKSSIINSLKRSRAVGVSATPGSTRVLQEIQLDSKVTLIDCPGVIFDDNAGTSDGDATQSGLLLRNVISVDAVEDPQEAVDGILRRCAPEKMMMYYSIPEYENTDEFLSHVAAKTGKLLRGGVPDKEKAARLVLQDWNSGQIPFFVLPPEDEEIQIAADTNISGSNTGLRVSGSDVGTASIVADWSKVSIYI